jgi:hypothetical protein
MKVHELKTLPSFFECVSNGKKPFEIRKNDRDFTLGDVLLLREIEPNHAGQNEPYTGRMKAVKVTYITNWEQKPGFVVMGISII